VRFFFDLVVEIYVYLYDNKSYTWLPISTGKVVVVFVLYV
jgi:hypothetical protein